MNRTITFQMTRQNVTEYVAHRRKYGRISSHQPPSRCATKSLSPVSSISETKVFSDTGSYWILEASSLLLYTVSGSV
ncbi:hypothetical protein J6590_087760 [Homalodisca vitripennis]|nr:hypothetical protein J6590_087760 [Homalodisca vitripennis]